ncbi:hypothetical protein [Thalassospira profundimaris]|uniref:Uncharacterized protein n=1 Tax=Thalassospira profundimaris TaxID=502049 RepID=A0A367WYT0_9PROT|nr:hypothetical protein [Thalassospira profundimaris]RCK46596.1 hypothetical protein TH30_08335 [Thalassospira profundimaris]
MDILHIARQQLLTAIQLFFDNSDPVSVHTLAGAASEILSDLCEQAGEQPFHSAVIASNPRIDQNRYFKARNLYRNAFKHVGRTKDEKTRNDVARNQFSDMQNDLLLFTCVEDYLRLVKRSPAEFQAMHLWFIAAYPDRLKTPKLEASSLNLLNNLHEIEREKQKEIGHILIKEFKNNPNLMNDPRTEY